MLVTWGDNNRIMRTPDDVVLKLRLESVKCCARDLQERWLTLGGTAWHGEVRCGSHDGEQDRE